MVKTSKNYWRRKPEGPWRGKEEKGKSGEDQK